MKPLTDVLADYATSSVGNEYTWYLRDLFNEETSALVRRFLYSTMDEVRLRTTNQYADLVLSPHGASENYMRKVVLRREVSGDIEIADGLLNLITTSLFYRIYYGLPEDELPHPQDSKVWKHIKEILVSGEDMVPAYWWWGGLVGATA